MSEANKRNPNIQVNKENWEKYRQIYSFMKQVAEENYGKILPPDMGEDGRTDAVCTIVSESFSVAGGLKDEFVDLIPYMENFEVIWLNDEEVMTKITVKDVWEIVNE